MLNNFQKSLILVVTLLLLVTHVFMAKYYTKSLSHRALTSKSELTVLSDDAYAVLSVGNKDFLSIMLSLYAIYHPATYNIPSADFKPLMSLLERSANLDLRNMQPYYQVIYYWSWAKDDERRILMSAFMLTGLDRFPENWEIPYTLYRLNKGIDDDKALEFLLIAGERAALYDGPAWLVDYPPILMSRDGDTMEAYIWTMETYQKTTSEAHRKTLLAQLETLAETLKLEGIDLTNDRP